MTDSQSSEEEMHDIEWPDEDIDDYSEYDDPTCTYPQIAAVLEDDIKHLKCLLKSGQSANINDSSGNTPLHVAIITDKPRMFHFLIHRKDVRLDAANFCGITPLMMSLKYKNEYFARHLIASGVDLNWKRDMGDTALHYAVQNVPTVVQFLLDKGASINEQNYHGETPLYMSCVLGDCDTIHLLLCYGADASIPCSENVLPLAYAMKKCPADMQDILFLYTFGEGPHEVGLRNFALAMASESPLFYQMMDLTSRVLYDDKDLCWFAGEMSTFSKDMFRAFIHKFGDAVEDVFTLYNPLVTFLRYSSSLPADEKPDFANYLYTLCECPYIGDAVQGYDKKICLTEALMGPNVSEDTLTKVVCCLMSRGVPIGTHDMNVVYEHFGYCELFKIMLNVEIADVGCPKEPTEYEKHLVPMLTYDLALDFEFIQRNVLKHLDVNGLERLGRFFALPRAKLPDNSSPQVPSLVQLSRDAARKHIIKNFTIKNQAQFYTILGKLPIGRMHKEILSYERSLYC